MHQQHQCKVIHVHAVYLIICNGRIVKIGGTKTGMRKRIGSYHCGYCVSQRTNNNGEHYPGRMSVTNAYCYNTIDYYIINGLQFELYYYPIPDHSISLDVFGENITTTVQLYEEYEQKALNTYRDIIGTYPPLCNNGHP